MKAKPKEKVLPLPPDWKVPTALVPLLFVPWSILVLVLYFKNFPFSADSLGAVFDQVSAGHLFHAYMAKCLGALAIALWLCWVAYRTGRWILERCVPAATLYPLEIATFGFGIGFGFLSLLTFGISVAQIWYPVVFWAILGALSLYFLVKRPVCPAANSPAPPSVSAPWNPLWILFLGAILLIFLWGDWSPEIFYDSLHYHLAVTNLYRIHHGLYALPTLLCSNFVMMIHMVYGLALTLNNELTAKLMHGALAAFLAVGFFAFGQRFLSRGAGIVASLVFLSMPIVAINAQTTGIDVGYSFFQLASAYALIMAFTDTASEIGWLRVAGLLTGLCATCKYTAFSTVPFGILLIAWHYRFDKGTPWNTVFRNVLNFLIPSVLVICPFLIKNTLYNKNPLYPFGGTRWGVPKIDPIRWIQLTGDTSPQNLRETLKSANGIWHLIAHPWFISLHGGSNADFVGPLFLLFLPLPFLIRKTTTAWTTLRRYFVLLWAQWMVLTTAPRFGLAALSLLALLIAEPLLTLAATPLNRIFVFGVLALGVFDNLYYQILTTYNTAGWKVVGGLVSEREYLSEFHPSYPPPPYAGIVWINEHLPADAKVLFIGDARSHYIQRAAVPSSTYDVQPLFAFATNARTGTEMIQAMRAQGITHLFMNYYETVRTENYHLFPFDPPSWKVFSEFWSQYVELTWKDDSGDAQHPRALVVYRLLNDQEAAKPHQAPQNLFERWKPK